MKGSLDDASTAQLERVIVWRRLDLPGAEYCKLSFENEKWCLKGSVVLVLESRPLQVQYQIRCNAGWETEEVTVNLDIDGSEEALQLLVDEQHRWWAAGRELTDLQGCVDIDLGVTPSTNTLPIRRLGLAIGQTQNVRAAWIKFPSLEARPFPQTYTRIGENLYRYESNNGSFMAEIKVDTSGLVSYYPDGWECSALV
jgi:hypothetical protein